MQTMIKANVIVDYPYWKKKIPEPSKYLNKKLKKLRFYPFKKNREFSILLTNNKKIKKLNLKFRKINRSTDVLSFPVSSFNYKNKYLGDIAISFQYINKRALTTNFTNEFDKMWIHGYLHLVGYDHKNNNDYKKMLKKEKLILNFLNIKN